MISAKLLVERGSIHDASQDWGEYSFVALPSPGDRIAAHYSDNMHYMTVICVHHKPVRITDAHAPDNAPQPAAHVVAKWTSCD